MKNKIILGGSIVIVLIASWFYWYEWRPSKTISFCASSEPVSRLRAERSGIGSDWISKYEANFRDCMRRFGYAERKY